MLRQYIAIFLLCIFNFILVGHSIIPHNHEEVDAPANDEKNHSHAHAHHHHHHSTKHSDKANEENDKKESNGLSDFFSLVIHVSEFVRSENRIGGIEQTELKQESLFVISFLTTRSFLTTDQKSEGIHYRDPDYYPPPNSYKGLRAPPLFFS